MTKQIWEDDFEMESEYDFSDGVPNPFAEQANSEQNADSSNSEPMRPEDDLPNAVNGNHAERYAAGVEVRIDSNQP